MAGGPFSEKNDYVINSKTLLLEPIQSDEYTLVYEKGREPFTVTKRPLNIIRQSCIRYLNTYDGKRNASAIILGTNRKVPVNIDEIKGTYLFPTSSHLKHNCVWITLAHLKELEEVDKKRTKITFIDYQSVIVPVSALAIYNQVNLTKALYERGNAPTESIVKEKVNRAQYVTGAKGNVISFFHPPKRE